MTLFEDDPALAPAPEEKALAQRARLMEAYIGDLMTRPPVKSVHPEHVRSAEMRAKNARLLAMKDMHRFYRALAAAGLTVVEKSDAPEG